MTSGKENLGTRIGARLGSAIIRGEFPPDTTLPTEHSLAKHFEVSRSAVREAIKVLTAKGLVHARRREGTIVNFPDQWNFLDPDILEWLKRVEYSHQLLHEMAQVRLALEPEACAVVAKRREFVDFRPLGEAVQVMEDAESSDEALLIADRAFHLGIMEATGNRFFRQFKPLLNTTLEFAYESPDLFEACAVVRNIDAEEHHGLLKAMLDGRSEDARRMSRAMIAQVADFLEAEVAKAHA